MHSLQARFECFDKVGEIPINNEIKTLKQNYQDKKGKLGILDTPSEFFFLVL